MKRYEPQPLPSALPYPVDKLVIRGEPEPAPPRVDPIYTERLGEMVMRPKPEADEPPQEEEMVEVFNLEDYR